MNRRKGDQQYPKCTNCSRWTFTTCTVSTLELPGQQCVHLKEWEVMREDVRGKTCKEAHVTDTDCFYCHTYTRWFFLIFFKWPATIASMFQWHVLYFSILKIQIDGWAVGGGTTPWATLKHPFINLDICPLSFFLPLSPSVRWGGGNIKRRTPSCWLGATQLKWTEKQALQTEGATRAVDFEYFTNYTRCTLAGGPWGKNGGKW